jgi:thiol-disulfide isomerase/thioredoxin
VESRRGPEFELGLLSGGTLSSADLEGSPVVLNVWASWCTPCREEAPVFERLWREYEDEGVRFVGVNTQDTEEGALDFVKDFGMTYPVVFDREQELVEQLDLVGLPQTFFLDSDYEFEASSSQEQVGTGRGTVVLGAMGEKELRDRIEGLLEDEAPASP